MFNTLGIEILYVPLGEGFINFRILFFKIQRFSEFLIDLSRLLHSIITEKKEFLKQLCLKWKWGIFLDNLVLWEVVWRGSNS